MAAGARRPARGGRGAQRLLPVGAALCVLAACAVAPVGPGGPSGASPAAPASTTEAAAPPSSAVPASPVPSSRVPSSPAPSPTTPASPVPASWRGQDVEVLPTSEPVVALTFDGGASGTAVADILATLAGHDVPATFFVTGAFARSFPSAVRQMAAAGHLVGNHSDTHPAFPQLTNESIRAQLELADRAIAAQTGRSTRPYFRFPYGSRTPLDVRVVNDAGYVPFRWTVDTLGWRGTSGGESAASVRDRVVGTARPGQIVLMHVGANPTDGSTLDADALPGILDDLRALGYRFVRLDEYL